MSKRKKLAEDDVNEKMKRLRSLSNEQLINLFKKYRSTSSLNIETEATHRLLAKQRELYLSDWQYAEIESLETLERTTGEDAALATREKLAKLHCMGKGKYFSPLTIIMNGLVKGIVFYIAISLFTTIIASLLYWYASDWTNLKIIIPPFPIDPSQKDFAGRVFVVISMFSIGIIYYILTDLIPDIRFLLKTYEKHYKRIQNYCNSK